MRAVLCLFVLCISALADGLILAEPVVSEEHGGPAAPEDREFAPGERVFLRFRVGGFAKEEQSNQVFLEYSIQAVDRKETPFEEALKGRLLVKTMRSESRFLLYSFEVPPSPLSGEAKFRIEVQDRIGGTSLKTEVPFRIRTNLPELTEEFAVTGFRYYRSEFDETPVEEPVFRPGDTVWGRFYLSGHEWAENYRYKLSYGVTLRNKAGKVLFAEMQAVSESRESFYPKWHVPGVISVRLEYQIHPGEHTITIDARDDNSGKAAKAGFPIVVR